MAFFAFVGFETEVEPIQAIQTHRFCFRAVLTPGKQALVAHVRVSIQIMAYITACAFIWADAVLARSWAFNTIPI